MTELQHVFEPATTPIPTYAAVLLHGTGANEHDLVPLGRTVAPGKALLSPLGEVRENGMPRWFRRLREGVFDEEDLRRRSGDLANFLTNAAQRYDIASKPLVAVGFSNGANIAASLLLLHPDTLGGAVLLRAMTPLDPENLPDLSNVPVYIGAGRADPLIAPDDVQRLADMLSKAGADVTLRWVDAGHGLTAGEVEDVRAWLSENEGKFASLHAGPE